MSRRGPQHTLYPRRVRAVRLGSTGMNRTFSESRDLPGREDSDWRIHHPHARADADEDARAVARGMDRTRAARVETCPVLSGIASFSAMTWQRWHHCCQHQAGSPGPRTIPAAAYVGRGACSACCVAKLPVACSCDVENSLEQCFGPLCYIVVTEHTSGVEGVGLMLMAAPPTPPPAERESVEGQVNCAQQCVWGELASVLHVLCKFQFVRLAVLLSL